MKTLLAILVLTFLAGCAELGAAKTAVSVHGAQAADAALEVSEWGVCEATTMGAWQRRYGKEPGKAEAWKGLCSKAITTP